MKMIRYFYCSLLLVTVGFVQATESETTNSVAETTTSKAEGKMTSAEKGSETTNSATKPMTPEEAEGQKLYDKECTGCHGIDLYTRENHNVKDYLGLKTQIQTCATNLSKPWFEEEIGYVAAYLNTFYKFEIKPDRVE